MLFTVGFKMLNEQVAFSNENEDNPFISDEQMTDVAPPETIEEEDEEKDSDIDID